MVQSFTGKNRVAAAFEMLAASIIKVNDLPARHDQILFVVDEQTATPQRKTSDIFAISDMWSDVLFQLTLRRFRFLIKFIGCNINNTSPEVFSALLYHELRHIKEHPRTGALFLDKHHDVEEWEELVKYGDWEKSRRGEQCSPVGLPNLMEEKIYGGTGFGDNSGERLSGVSGGLLALPSREGIEAAPVGDREPQALSGVHFEGGE